MATNASRPSRKITSRDPRTLSSSRPTTAAGRQSTRPSATELHATGALADDDREFRTLTHRSDMTGADREWAARYQAGDILKYTSGSKLHGIERESTARVVSTNGRDNTLTVEREDGQTVTYDPKRLKGANVYQEVTREFATGDRIQFTAPDKQLEVNNRDLATIVKLEDGQITVQMDTKGGRFVTFDPAKMRSFDHGYAVTSHSSQGLTEGRVIANIDTESSRSLINTRLAYVAISRASEDATDLHKRCRGAWDAPCHRDQQDRRG